MALAAEVFDLTQGASNAIYSVAFLKPRFLMVESSCREEPRLKRRLELGEFVVSVQIYPPYVDENKPVWEATNEFAKLLLALKEAGVKIIDINSSRGKKRRIFMTSTQLAGEAKRGFDIDAIPHVTTRDTSLAGLLNEIESTYAIGGITDFLIITGDPHDTEKDFPHKEVYEVNSIGALKTLNRHIKPRDAFSLAAAFNQNEKKKEANRIKRKIDAGADFFMSQTIFNMWQVERLADFYHKYSPKPLIIGVWPLIRERTVVNLYEGKIPGVVLDDESFLLARQFFGDDKSLERWGLERAAETITRIRNNRLAQGVYLVAPSHNPLLSIEVLRTAGLL